MLWFILTICLYQTACMADIHYETLRGDEISPTVNIIAELCNTVYREYPYFYDGSSAEYADYLRSYAATPNGVVCIAYEGQKPIGLAAGKPMGENRQHYQQPFIYKGQDIPSLFYAGELVLLPHYRGQSITEQMYLRIEAVAKENPQYKTICIAEIDESRIKAQKPLNYTPFDLTKIGFVRQDLHFLATWRNLNESDETPHMMTYWTKPL